MLSPLLGPTNKPVFEILYRSGNRAFFQLEPDITLPTFTSKVVRLARAEKLKINNINPSENLYLIENLVWLTIISPEHDLQAIREELLSRLLYTQKVKGAFILICEDPPRWGWVQVSEGARIVARSYLRNHPARLNSQLEVRFADLLETNHP